MTRITPRTCLYPLTGALLLTFGLSIGLTFRSNTHCYANVCGEVLFPLQARLHVIVWYFWLSISVTVLATRAFSPEMRKILKRPLFERKLPLIQKELTISGVLVVLWVWTLYGIIVGIWWRRLDTYFQNRGSAGGVHRGNGVLAAIALTGHLADVTFGFVLLPISRHSALSSFFKLSVSTTLAFHMVAAYTLFTLVCVHGLLYVAWVPTFERLSSTLRQVFPVLNPTYLNDEVWPGLRTSLAIWRAGLIATGTLTFVILVVISITTLPYVRSKHFNVFYFTHFLGIIAVVVICLHASTMLYCTAPGLAMWLLDWGMRLYELGDKMDGKLTTLGKGWYCLTLDLNRHRLDGCACDSPLAHFYIYHSGSSMRELHPFSTITHLKSELSMQPARSDTFPVQFLFRKRGKAPRVPPTSVNKPRSKYFFFSERSEGSSEQWTDKLAGMIDAELARPTPAKRSSSRRHMTAMRRDSHLTAQTPETITAPSVTVHTSLRAEGPYFTPANPDRFNTVICIVAGTGISGAISIAAAFADQARLRAEGNGTASQWARCVLVWTVREADYVELPFIQPSRVNGLEIRVHKTGNGQKRLDAGAIISELVDEKGSGKCWAYISGPNAFIIGAEDACKKIPGLEYYGARWDI